MTQQKILIVDDSKTIRMQVKDMLPAGRFEILEAQDGVEGLNLIQQAQPSLVLLDVFMPRMNGWEVVQKIQTQQQFQGLPVVMMSGQKADVEQAAPELFDYFEFVTKPFDQKGLLSAIRSAMAKAKQRQPIAPAAAPIAAPAAPPAAGGDELQTLKAAVQDLQAQNAKLRAEVDSLKKQTAQILAFVRQKLR